MMYIVKGKIREYVHFGNNKLIRKGSPHFLPNTEVFLSHYYQSQYRFHHKVWVRGLHRSGLLKKKPVYFKFLTDLKLEEVKNPSPKTSAFIRNNQILTIDSNSDAHTISELNKLLDFFNTIEEPVIQPCEIKDDLYINAKAFTAEIQLLLMNQNIDKLVKNYMKFPIEVKYRKGSKPIKVNKYEFELKYKDEFVQKIGKTIIDTEIESIFPTNKKMILGLAEIEIKNGCDFQIAKIEVE